MRDDGLTGGAPLGDGIATPPDGDNWGGETRNGIVWSTLTYIGARALTFGTTIVLARLLAPSQFGLVAAVLVYLSLMELASDLGMNATVVFEQQRGVTRRIDVAFTVNLLVALVLAGAGVALAPLFASLFGLGGHAALFRLGALSLVFTGLGNIHDSLLLRDLAFRRRIIPQLVRAGTRGGVSIVLALSGMGASALVIGMIAGSAAWTVTQWLLTGYRPTLALDRDIVRSMAAYGGAAVVLEVIAVVATRVDQVVISRVLGQGPLGLYSIAFRVPEMVIDSVAWNVSVVAFPALARRRTTHKQGLGEATLLLMRYQTLYAAPVAAGLSVLASPLVVVLFSHKWHAAGGVMSAVAVMSGISAIAFPLGDVFKATGKQRTLVALASVQVPIFIVAIIIVASEGILVVAWARAASAAIHAVLVIALVMRTADIDLRRLLVAARPGLAAGLGVAAGAGAVRVLWPALSVGPLLLGSLAALTGGVLALRLLAPGTLDDLRDQLPPAWRRPRAPVGAGT